MGKFIKSLMFLAFILPFTLYSQSNLKYAEYYNTINQAELRVVDLNFKEAYNTYKQVFPTFEKRHLQDLYNATLCAIHIGEYRQAEAWINEMITKGAELTQFNTKTFKMLPDTVWFRIKQNYNLLRGLCIARVDTSYKAKLNILREQEQLYLVNKRSQESYDSLVYEHAKVLYALISEHGLSPVPIFERAPLPIDVMRHHFGLRNRLRFPQENGIDLDAEPYRSMNFAQYDLEPLLRQAVFSGDLTPGFLGHAMDHGELDPNRKISGFVLYVDLNTRTVTHDSISEEKLNRIDLYRESIGLESTRDAAKKDIEVALFYNQETFPFDEFIRKFKEIGYTKKAFDSIKFGSAEFDSLSMKAASVLFDTKQAFYKTNTFKMDSKLDDKTVTFENKWEILKEFRFNQTIAYKAVIPLKK